MLFFRFYLKKQKNLLSCGAEKADMTCPLTYYGVFSSAEDVFSSSKITFSPLHLEIQRTRALFTISSKEYLRSSSP